ncbi:hypothetical protein FPCIR_8924 [Fusarium pseudocircinatum]|uniref:Uncharacterized protein n=1 Tax=Fusarium pseudocircinatum TaxID=56676 RepID=A0A8H5KZV2_9HYPO|nr:hypothetical protein FPCIR_8924 [Fusarium pseudocircinatum]
MLSILLDLHAVFPTPTFAAHRELYLGIPRPISLRPDPQAQHMSRAAALRLPTATPNIMPILLERFATDPSAGIPTLDLYR